MGNCKLCGQGLIKNYCFDNYYKIDCSNCGRYNLEECLEADLDLPKYQPYLYKVSCWIREKNDELEKSGSSQYPRIDQVKFGEILDMKDKTIQEKFDLMMIQISFLKEYDSIGKKEITRCWVNGNDFYIIYQKAIDQNLIIGSIQKSTQSRYPFFQNITFDGKQYVESLNQPNKSSKKIFVAFNFKENLINVFDKHVREAIEEEGFIYTVVNQNNNEHNKAISDEIIANLKSCKILIADFTNHRNSVYFESGFAMGMKIPIIWTCKEGHTNDLSFDTRQYPHLVWKDGEDLKQKIKNRIKVIV